MVDNFGDIGVCWRLAKQLHQELGQEVSLWVDNLESLHAICPEINAAQSQQCLAGINVHHWQAGCEAGRSITHSNTVVIEAFGCNIPGDAIDAIKHHHCQWLNLEYLALEPWADSFHLASSPVHGCQKTFFVPGFSPSTGGLLIDEPLRRLIATPQNQARESLSTLLTDLGFDGLQGFENHYWVSVFSYPNAPMPWLINALSTGPQTLILVSEGHALAAINRALGTSLIAGMQYAFGAATIVALPFLSQTGFDQVLGACDFNIVRGEESAVRAQLLGKPFLWQLYPQEENAHHDKLHAFLQTFLKDCTGGTAVALEALFKLWNGYTAGHENIDLGALLGLHNAKPPIHSTTGQMQGAQNQVQTHWQSHCALWQKTLLNQGSLANKVFNSCV